MKAVKIDLAGRTRYLAFTVEAMFQIQEVFGGSGELIDALKDIWELYLRAHGARKKADPEDE